MKIIERIYILLEHKGIKPTVLEKKIHLSNGYFSVQKKRNADVGENAIKKVVIFFSDVNIEWLITGKGAMLKHQNEPTELTGKDLNEKENPVSVPYEALKTANDLLLAAKKREEFLLTEIVALKEKISKLEEKTKVFHTSKLWKSLHI